MNPAVLASTDTFHITFLASFLIWIMFIGLIILWIIDGKIKKEQVLHAILAIIVSWGISSIIKSLIPTLRPFMLNGRNPLTLTIPIDGAFPSTHATVAFACAISVLLHSKKSGAVFIVLAVLVSIGRVMSNVHHLPDVIAGVIIGTVAAYALRKVHLYKAL